MEPVKVQNLFQISTDEEEINAAEAELSYANEDVANFFHCRSKLTPPVVAGEAELDGFSIVGCIRAEHLKRIC